MHFTPSDVERFWKKVNKTSECWEWTASLSPKGYGRFEAQRHYFFAHRVIDSLVNGALPDELRVLHRCNNRKCVRPDHLYRGTQADNLRQMCDEGRHRGRYHYGEDHTNSKLTAAIVTEIRRRYALGTTHQRALAAEYGIHQATLQKIVNRTAWKHVA